jgi:hypothetical protein
VKLVFPAFGLISGIGTAIGLLPHVFILCILLFIDSQRSITSMIIFTLAAKFLGEWIFWKHCKERMDSESKLKNWRSVVEQSLLSHPNVFTALLMMFADIFVDVTLVHTALKTSVPPIWVFVALLGCQMIASPVQGALSDYFSQKKSMLFAAFIGIAALIFSLEIPVEGKIWETPMYLLNLTGLSSFPVAVQMAIILCGKGLLGNITVIARAAIAEVIKVETLEKSS